MNAHIETVKAQLHGVFDLNKTMLEHLSTSDLGKLADECGKGKPEDMFTVRMAREIIGIAATKILKDRS